MPRTSASQDTQRRCLNPGFILSQGAWHMTWGHLPRVLLTRRGIPKLYILAWKTTDTLKLQILKSWSKWLPGIFLPFKDKSKSINSLKTIKATVIYKFLYSNNDMRKQWLIRIKVPVGISRVNVWMFHLSPLHQALPWEVLHPTIKNGMVPDF